MLGLYSCFCEKKIRFGIFWFAFSIFVLYLSIKWVAPHFYEGDYFYLSGNYLAWKHFGIRAFMNHVFQPSTFMYFVKIFLPLGFLSFLSPSSFVLTLPILAQNLLTRNIMARSIYFQYTAFLTPFVFISSIYGFRNALTFIHKINQHRLKLFLIYWIIGTSLLSAGVSEYYVINEYLKEDNAHYSYVRKYLRTISSSYSVRTHEFFAAHLFNRRELHIYENGNPREGGSFKALNSDLVILDRTLLGADPKGQIDALLAKNYVIQHERDGFYVLSKLSK